MFIDPAEGFDAKQPRTYVYVAEQAADGTPERELQPIDQLAMREIDYGLERIGWTRVKSVDEADMLVSYGGDAETSSRAGGIWVVGYGGVSDYGGRTSLEGWITVVLVDNETREEVWRGTKLAHANATEEHVRKVVSRVLRQLMKQLAK